MSLAYFDTSVLLAILLEEDRQAEAYEYWKNSFRVSSILLKIETIIGIRRIYEINKKRLGIGWLNNKTGILDEFLNEVNFMILDNTVEREIFLRKDLARCRSLDAVHIATALKFKEINGDGEIYFYTYDKTMHSLASHYKFKTNKI